MGFNLVFIWLCACSLSNAYPVFMSVLYKDKAQAEFVSSLNHYYIARPRFSLSRHVHLQKLSWNTIKTLQPELFYAKLRFNYQTFKLELRQNRHLISKGFSLEDDVRNVEDLSRYERPSADYYKKIACYYSGHIYRKPKSRVALSICDGLKGFISYEEGTFFIEPMKQIGPNLLHLVYEAKAELNSTHNPKKGQKLTCSTGNLHKDVASTSQNKIFNDNYFGKSFIIPNEKIFKRKVKSTANLEVFIVVDKYMVEFHGNDSVQDYVLTMMNMVSDMYNEPSLGVRINIVVAKVLILHSDLPDLKISHNGDKTLFSFCEWQFLRELSNQRANVFPRSYDVALLLTRKDVCAHSNRPCGTIGLAYIGGTCSPNRKCGVVEDIGLNTAYTIAHELGHNLGMTHDRLDNDCNMRSGRYPHIMAAKWPTANHVSMKWSACSRKTMQTFLSSYKSYCLRETFSGNRLSDFHRSGILPGQLYNADTQCKQQYGGVAKHCPYFKLSGKKTELCHQLWCEIEEENECVSKLDPAAKGTKCDEGKWCMYGRCVNNTDIPDAVHGGWGPWFNWTKCSRTCGVGISFMERFCNKPYPLNGGQYCAGEARRYTTCNTQPCPENSPDIRTIQCEEFNNGTVTYMPIHSESQPCALHCRPRKNTAHYSVKLKNKVTDGTPCREDSSDICVNGKCEKLGCDLKLNSDLETDICGVCGGHGETCNLIEGEFNQPLGKGYVHAVDIPLGAKNVLVKEVKPCASFLALKSGHGSYHINGNWTIGLPGRYNVNGTVIYYRRRGTQEFFFTDGPTLEEMHFMILYQDFNFGVKYRYVLPLNKTVTNMNDKESKGSFGWVEGTWKRCSVVCGGGIMRQEKPRCLHMYDGKINLVNDSLCSGARKPPTSVKACNEHECPKVWFVTPWNTCSKTCGLGRQKRSVSCKEQQKDGTWLDRLQSSCDVSEKPVAIQTCVQKSCYLSWKVSAWSKCRAKCGHDGFKYREVTCPMVDSCLVSLKPKNMLPCKGPPCVYSWIPEPWIQCSTTCGIGIQTREVFCREEDSFVKTSGMCNSNLKPKTRRKCYMKLCPYVRAINDVPIVKRKVSKSLISEEKTRTKRIFRLPGPSTVSRKKLNPQSKECLKDELGAVVCNMKIIISRYANKPFCKISQERDRCCLSCRQHLKYLPVTPRRQKT